jgi:hypothetical protein
MAYVPLETADMAAGKPARGGSFALRIDQNFEDHEARLLAEEAVTADVETRLSDAESDITTLQTKTAESELTVTTTGNIDNLALGGATLLRMNNATLATIRGIAAPTAGQPKEVVIVSVGAGQLALAHENAGSTAANRLINFTTASVLLPIGTGNAARYRYDETTDRWRLVSRGPAGEYSTWTPTDTSGAGLSFSGVEAYYEKIGPLVVASFKLTYPSTASGLEVKISGLPYASQNTTASLWGGSVFYTTYATPFTVLKESNNTQLVFYHFGGAAVTNANFSTKEIRAVVIYRAGE